MSATSAGPPSGLLPQNLLHLMKVWSACAIGPESFICVVCIFRLKLRSRTNGLWWDDYFTLVALVAAMPFFASTWLILIVREMPPHMQTAIGWIYMVVQMVIVCAARISLALAIARILLPTSRVFRITIVACWLYFLCWVGSICQFVITFLKVRKSIQREPPYMRNARYSNLEILPLIMDVASDIFLVCLALSQFWHVRLRTKGARVLVLMGFCASILVSPGSLLVGLLCLLPIGLTPYGVINRTMSSHIQVFLALLACNSLVVMTYVYQLVHGEDEALMSEITALSRRPTPATSTQTSCSCGSNREISQHHESRSDPLILTEVESEWSSSI